MFPIVLQLSCGQVPLSSLPDVLEACLLSAGPPSWGAQCGAQTSHSLGRVFATVIIFLFVGGDGIPVELFQILKDDAVKVLHSTCQQIWKTQQWPQDWKCQFSFQSQRKAMPKNAQTTAQLHSSHTLVK